MSNYISLNAKYYKNDEFKKIYEHDFRKSDVTYLLKDTQYKNVNFEFDTFENLKAKKAHILAQKGKREQSKENTLIEFVCALSREETEKLLKSKDGYSKLEQALKQVMLDIQVRYGFTPIFGAFHGDEGHKNGKTNLHNFHAHLTFFNFDFEKERSVLRTIQKGEWSKMQDVAALAFEKHNLDFKRGEKKETKEKDHLERKLYIGAKKEAIKDINVYLETSVNNVIDNSIEKGIFSNKINETLLKQNIKKEVFKALKFDIMPPKEKEKIKKHDELQLQNNMLKKEVEELQKIKQVAQTMIEDFENIDNLKKDILRAEEANNFLHNKVKEKDLEIEKLSKKVVEQSTTIYTLNNQIQAQKLASKSKDREIK